LVVGQLKTFSLMFARKILERPSLAKANAVPDPTPDADPIIKATPGGNEFPAIVIWHRVLDPC